MTPAVTGPSVLKRYSTSPSPCTQDDKVSCQLAGENNVTRSRCHRRQHRTVGMVFPRDRAGRRIHRAQPTAGLSDRIECKGSAHILLAGYVSRLVRLLEDTAPIDRRRYKHFPRWTEGRGTPFEPAKDTGTGVDAFNCGLGFCIGDRRKGYLVDLLVTFPVDSSQNSVLSCNRHHRPAHTGDYRRVQRVGHGQVPVMLVVRNELPEPLELATSGADLNHRGGVQILAHPHTAEEIRHGIADGDVE